MLKVLVTIGGMQVVAMAAMLLRTKGLALILGPADLGVMAVIDKLVAMVSQTASLSLPFAAIRFLPAIRERRDDFEQMRRAMSLTVLTCTSVAALVAAAVTVVYPDVWGRELSDARGWLLVGLLTVPVVAQSAFLPNALAGALDHLAAMRFTVGHAVVLSASGLVGAAAGGVPGVYLTYLVLGGVVVVSLGLGRVLLGARVTHSTARLPPAVWRFALAMLALAWLVPYAALFTHYQVLRHFGAVASGHMQAAMGIALAVRTVLGSGHQFFLTPNVNRSGSPAERLAWAVQYQRMLGLLVGVATPPLLLGADIAVRLLYSRAFLPAASDVWLFVLAEVLTLFVGTYQSLILAFDHLRYHVLQNLVAQATTIALAIVLVPRYGIAGAAIAPIAGQGLIWAGTLLFLRRHFSLRVPAGTATLTAAALLAVVLAGLAGAHLPWTSAGVLGRGVAWAAGVGLLAVTTNREERAKIVALLGLGPPVVTAR